MDPIREIEVEVSPLRSIVMRHGAHIRDPGCPNQRIDSETLGLTVVLDVDGADDVIYIDDHVVDQLAVLDRAAAAIVMARVRLAEEYGDQPRPTQCMAIGQWGRCRQVAHDSDTEHAFPLPDVCGRYSTAELHEFRTRPWEGSPA